MVANNKIKSIHRDRYISIQLGCSTTISIIKKNIELIGFFSRKENFEAFILIILWTINILEEVFTRAIIYDSLKIDYMFTVLLSINTISVLSRSARFLLIIIINIGFDRHSNDIICYKLIFLCCFNNLLHKIIIIVIHRKRNTEFTIHLNIFFPPQFFSLRHCQNRLRSMFRWSDRVSKKKGEFFVANQKWNKFSINKSLYLIWH